MSIRTGARAVNLIGDHTDYTGGLVFPIAINRWTEIRGERSQRITLISEDEFGAVELATQPTHPHEATPTWGRYVTAVRDELAHRQKFDGISGTISTTLPIGAGLSSSASLMVATAIALGFDGSTVDLALLARRAVVAATGVPTGIMDQLHRKRDTRPPAHRLQRPHDRSCRSTRRRKDRSSIYCTSNTPRLGVFGKGQRMLTSRGRDRSASRQSFRHRRDH